MVFVQWTSGDGEVLIRFRAYVFDVTKEEVHFGTEEDRGNINMMVSLTKCKVVRMEKTSIDLSFESGAKMSMYGVLQ